MEREIVIKPKYEINEYFKVNLYIYSRSPIILIVLILFALMIFTFLTLFILGSFSDINMSFDPSFVVLIIWPLLMIYFIHNKTKKILENSKISENIQIKYNNSFFEEIGQTFNIKYYWKEIKKIKETENWFLIYVKKNQVKVIVKRDLKNQEYNELKELFNSLNIKKSLK